ncbi:MAG: DUF2155 domain-containing protein [Hyphomicrobiaceae bacterium]
MSRLHSRSWLPRVVLAGVAASCLGAAPASAQRIENATAVFAALDKVTARIQKLEVKLGDTVTFGALRITPRTCFTRAPTEAPKTTSFVQVDEVMLDGKQNRIFSGWMFAESPGLNAVEHPVFDVWLTDCTQPQRGGGQPVAKGPGPAVKGQPPSADPPIDDDSFRRRPRR